MSPGLAATGGPLNPGTPLQIEGASGTEFETSPLLPDLRVSLLELNPAPRSVRLTSPGGDIGSFNVSVTTGDAVTWTNRDQTGPVDRRNPLRVAWNARAGVSTVAIAGGNYDEAADGSGVFLCLAEAAPGAFEVPPHILSVVPPTQNAASIPLGALFVGAVPPGGLSEFPGTGQERGLALFLQTVGKTTSFR